MPTILCVEDETDIRRDIIEELRGAGYDTIEAENGEEGLKAILACRPDLVLSDITMPVMNGYDLMRTIRHEHPEMAEMAFIFLSALADKQNIVAGRQLGADDYLVKPIDYDLLLATVESRLASVARMKARKEGQLVRLFQALTNAPPVKPEDETAPRVAGRRGEALAAPAKPEDEMASRESFTVVTVNDKNIDMSPIHQLLESQGHAVAKFSSGMEFIRSLERGTPDVVLLSYNTSDLLAPQMVKLVKEKYDVSFPIILLSLPLTAKALKPSVTGLFDACLTLPCDSAELMARIEVLASKRHDPADHPAPA